MFKTKFEDNEVNIFMSRETVEMLTNSGVNYVEVFRLIESFCQKLLVKGEDGEIRMENDDTRATIDLNVKWDVEAKKVQIDVVAVNLNGMGPRDMPKMPNGARVDLGQSANTMDDMVNASTATQ